jgi:ribonucleotide reductase beta subunit family protein with ferritin-like domain
MSEMSNETSEINKISGINEMAKEPLLTSMRKHLLPIQFEDIWAFYKAAEAAFWTLEEIDFNGDRRDFELLSPDEQHYLSHVLAFFSMADKLVFDNITVNFGAEIVVHEAKSFYAFQATMEGIHNEVYEAMIENLVAEPAKRLQILATAENYPGISRKINWARKYMDTGKDSFGTRLVGFVVLEYLFFSASFAAIYYFKKRGKMPGLCFSNELISRDEGLHAQFGCLLVNNYLIHKPSEESVHAMVREALDIETQFVRESLPVTLLGLNSESMVLYVQYIADHMLTALKYTKLYNVPNPFEWMEIISLQGKTNFFEKRVGEYSKAGVGGVVDTTFSLTEEF